MSSAPIGATETDTEAPQPETSVQSPPVTEQAQANVPEGTGETAQTGTTDTQAGDEEAEEGSGTLELDAILAEIAESDDYAESSNCLRMRAYKSVEILDDRHLLFIGMICQ